VFPVDCLLYFRIVSGWVFSRTAFIFQNCLWLSFSLDCLLYFRIVSGWCVSMDCLLYFSIVSGWMFPWTAFYISRLSLVVLFPASQENWFA
jgi:hypothetical protein